MSINCSAIPVVMYHTVGRAIPNWKWRTLTVPASVFEDHLKWLVRRDYYTADLDELRRHVAEEERLRQRSVVLTFDDGYLDNWTFVAPLLRKYGLKGTVFVNPDFVDPRQIIRPTLVDAWNRQTSGEELPVSGFMSWPELQSVDAEGTLRVESHAMTHTWYPTGPRIIDFHHPDDGYYWLDWNEYPAKKPFYLQNPAQTEVPLGTPVYEHQKSLAAIRFTPNPIEAETLADFVQQEGGIDFFACGNWRSRLFDKVRDIRKSKHNFGTYESEHERAARYYHELAATKGILQMKLGRGVSTLCWPGGGYDELARSIALELYSSMTLGSHDQSTIRNQPGDDYRFIRRIPAPEIESVGGSEFPGGRYLVHSLREYQGNRIARRCRQILKVLAMGRTAVFGANNCTIAETTSNNKYAAVDASSNHC